MNDNTIPGMKDTLADNIDRLSARRRQDEVEAPASDKLAARITGFAGSMTFVAIHLLLFGGWIAVNLGWLPILPPFDPSLVTLAMLASVEAIFLSTFVLISQNRDAAAAARRADLDLHISLLTEHELSRLSTLVGQIAERVGVAAHTPDLDEIAADVSPETVLDALKSKPS